MAAQDPEEQMVAVPAHPGADGQLILEARKLPEGLALPVFSSVRVLIDALGRFQPWAVISMARVADLASCADIDCLALDPDVADEAWRWEPPALGGGVSWEAST